MKIITMHAISDPGLVRKNNEDICLVDEQKGFCLVADGIGGASSGEVASRLFSKTILDLFSTSPPPTEAMAEELVRNGFYEANKAIITEAKTNYAHKGMGCTAELIVFYKDGFVLGHIGDSRTFLLRNQKLKQLTRDHSLVQEQLDQGLITEDEAKNHAYKNIITKAVGILKEPPMDLIKGITLPGDRFLLCSDGLTDMVDAKAITGQLLAGSTLEQKAEKLIGSAKAAGGKDNVTVVLAQIP